MRGVSSYEVTPLFFDMLDLYNRFLASSGVSTDTRTIERNALFFALSGSNFNGNKFAKSALKKGAVAVVVDDSTYVEELDPNSYFLVDNVLVTLQKLARFHRDQMKDSKVLGLTGSNGKTTTKELINAILKKKFKVGCTQGNLNNHIGVPLTILGSHIDDEILIVEMGANKIGDISELCQIADPNFGIITNIGKAHLEGFGGIEGVLKGKTELYKYLSSNSGVIFFNDQDIKLASALPNDCKPILYSIKDFELLECQEKLSFLYKGMRFDSHLSGIYNLENIRAAISIGEYFGIELSLIQDAIKGYIPNNNRSEWFRWKNNLVFKDAYNANPTSMKESLIQFHKSKGLENSVVIIGDMLELGEYSREEHKSLLSLVKDKAEIVRVIGKEFYQHRKTFPMYEFYENIDAYIETEEIQNFSGKNIFLKGSRGIALEKVLASSKS